MTTITIASIEKKERRSVIITTERRRLGVWTDKLGKFGLEVGGTYTVETEDSDFNGRTLTNIIQAKQVGSMPPAASAPATKPTNGSAKDEQIWVQGLLQAAIKAGLVPLDKQKLWEATQIFKGLYKHSFGTDDRIYPASEAGRHAA